ncbi:MAG: hypothetical protein K9G11_04740 [Rickettsiaceae bacterium]|nr:hypothetical protein [Rickettsiaceae bacterium]
MLLLFILEWLECLTVIDLRHHELVPTSTSVVIQLSNLSLYMYGRSHLSWIATLLAEQAH